MKKIFLLPLPDVPAILSAVFHTPFLKLFLPLAFVVPESCGSLASSLCSQADLTAEFELRAFHQWSANWNPRNPVVQREAPGNKEKLSRVSTLHFSPSL